MNITVDPGFIDIDSDDIVRTLVDESGEEAFLEEMAEAYESRAAFSKHDGERAFFRDGAVKLRECAKWLRENSP